MPSRQIDKDTTQTRTYKYGLVPKGYAPKAAINELYRANKLWNKLVEIHNENWKMLEEARKSASPSYAEISSRNDALTKEIEDAYAYRRTLRVNTGSTKGDDPQTIIIDKNIKDLKKQRADLWGDVKKQRKIADTHIDFKAFNGKRNKAFNEAVQAKNSEIGSKTANEVRRDFDNAREKILKNPGSGHLQFHRFDGTGYWQYRFRSKGKKVDGITFGELFEGNSPSKKDFIISDRDDSHSKPRLRLRAKLAGGQTMASKIYQEFDLILHRPLPEGAQIQNGKILRTRSGNKFRYDLVLVIKLPPPENSPVPKDNALGLDINFRYKNGEIEVMTLSSLDGQILDTITVPPKLLAAIDHIDTTKSDLDQSATELGSKIKPLLKQLSLHKKLDLEDINKLDDSARDRYYAERLCASVVNAPAHVTMSFEKAYKLAVVLKRHPSLFCEELTHHLTYWWKGHARRYQELHNLRGKQLRHRNDFYRQIAANIITHGMLISFEKNFLAKIAEVRDKNNKLGKKTRANRFLASPGILVAAVKNAAEREGIPWVDVPAKYTSKTCHVCGKVNKELKDEKEWRCSCGIAHDRDENAAKNIARLGLKKYNETLRK